MTVSREMATAFVESCGQTWQSWDYEGFVELFSDHVVYLEHPVGETVVGRDAMAFYIRRENNEAGTVDVRMGSPIVEGNRVVAEFWTTMSNREGEPEGTLMAQRPLPTTGRCTRFRQCCFETDGHSNPSSGWVE